MSPHRADITADFDLICTRTMRLSARLLALEETVFQLVPEEFHHELREKSQERETEIYQTLLLQLEERTLAQSHQRG